MQRNNPTDPHLVLVGAGHAHMYSLRRLKKLLKKGIRVTVISPSPFRYSGMGPGVLAGHYAAATGALDVQTLVEQQGGTYLDEKVERIDPVKQITHTASGAKIPYDVLSLNTGSQTAPLPENDGRVPLLPVKPIANFTVLRELINDHPPGPPLRVTILGGGPAGCETACAIHACASRNRTPAEVSILTGSSRLLPYMPKRAGARARARLNRCGIEITTNCRVDRIQDGRILSGQSVVQTADLVVAATGVEPTRPPLQTSPATDIHHEAMPVDARLRHPEHPTIFGGGDCVSFCGSPLPRVGVHAVRQGKVLWKNINAALNGGRLLRYRPPSRHLLILNMGDAYGIAIWGRCSIGGFPAARLKRLLDTRFMHRLHQSLREATAHA